MANIEAQKRQAEASLVQADLAYRRQAELLGADATARADYEAARATLATSRGQIAAYQQTVLQAFAEVDNALSNETRLAEQVGSAQAAYEAATRAEALYALRYRAGAAAARNLADTRRRRYEATVTLAKALGGGRAPPPGGGG